MANIIKVVRLKKIIDGLLLYIKNNYEAHETAGTVEDSFLYRLLYGNSDGNYDFYENAKKMFLQSETDPRQIATHLFFHSDTDPYPSVHVRELSRSKYQNGIGGDTGYYHENADGSYSGEILDTRSCQFEIMCASGNTMDTTLLSEVMYALMVGAQDTLIGEFQLASYNIKESTVTTSSSVFFIKSIIIETMYENNIPSINDPQRLISSINFVLSEII